MDMQKEQRKLVCVRFPAIPNPYIFDAKDLKLKTGDLVIVNTEIGQSVARVLGYATEADTEGLDEIKPILRTVTESDTKKIQKNIEKEKLCFVFCQQQIHTHGLPMKLIKVEQTFDGNKITFYFTSDGRVDFRELLKDLVEKYRTRIELRQIGTRQESAMLGGIGSCGREVCCASYLTNFQRISVKMAKDQNMTLNPIKISGLCGKLKCCLAYEREAYAELVENMPKPGKVVFLEQGEATIVSINIINQSFIAKLKDRRFIKAGISDILTEEEYIELNAENKTKLEQAEVSLIDITPKENAQNPKPKKRRSSRRRKSKSKRSSSS
ncbi:MAG: stage 0 sporulation protein [Deltaproteobacteria bacterium]|nr:stage 0 sporulation protein [Deltaproteobacteria bacterium]